MAFTEDLTQFVDTDDFGVAALYNGATTINGIFDNQFLGVPGEAQIASLQPMFQCRTVDVSSATAGQSLVVSGTTYYITGIHPDGTGMTVLMLRK